MKLSYKEYRKKRKWSEYVWNYDRGSNSWTLNSDNVFTFYKDGLSERYLREIYARYVRDVPAMTLRAPREVEV